MIKEAAQSEQRQSIEKCAAQTKKRDEEYRTGKIASAAVENEQKQQEWKDRTDRMEDEKQENRSQGSQQTEDESKRSSHPPRLLAIGVPSSSFCPA